MLLPPEVLLPPDVVLLPLPLEVVPFEPPAPVVELPNPVPAPVVELPELDPAPVPEVELPEDTVPVEPGAAVPRVEVVLGPVATTTVSVPDVALAVSVALLLDPPDPEPDLATARTSELIIPEVESRQDQAYNRRKHCQWR